MLPAALKRFIVDHDRWHRWRLGALMRPLYGGLGSILALHRVCERGPGARIEANRQLEVSPANLEAMVEFLKGRGYELVSMDEVPRILAGRSRRRKFVAVTLDDGYADSLTLALPLFRKHGVPFTVYVSTSFPDRTAVLWWYHLERRLLAAERIEVRVAGEMRTYRLADASDREHAFGELAHLIARAAPAEYGEVLHELLGAQRDDWRQELDRAALTWEQVAELAREPLATIGSHGTDHLAFARMSEADARAQMLGSKRRLELAVGREVRHLAFPYGSRWAAGPREFALAGECGYRTAVTTRSGNLFRGHARAVTSLPRIGVADACVSAGVERIELWLDGCVPCYENRFRRQVTV